MSAGRLSSKFQSIPLGLRQVTFFNSTRSLSTGLTCTQQNPMVTRRPRFLPQSRLQQPARLQVCFLSTKSRKGRHSALSRKVSAGDVPRKSANPNAGAPRASDEQSTEHSGDGLVHLYSTQSSQLTVHIAMNVFWMLMFGYMLREAYRCASYADYLDARAAHVDEDVADAKEEGEDDDEYEDVEEVEEVEADGSAVSRSAPKSWLQEKSQEWKSRIALSSSSLRLLSLYNVLGVCIIYSVVCRRSARTVRTVLYRARDKKFQVQNFPSILQYLTFQAKNTWCRPLNANLVSIEKHKRSDQLHILVPDPAGKMIKMDMMKANINHPAKWAEAGLDLREHQIPGDNGSS